jgi:hypothetical protein
VSYFGDGRINAFDPATGGDANTLYHTAGIVGPVELEDHGLFGSITPVTLPRASFRDSFGASAGAWTIAAAKSPLIL